MNFKNRDCAKCCETFQPSASAQKYCERCRTSPSGQRCTKCERGFIPSGRSLVCPKCRYYATKNLCGCGKTKAPLSSQCVECEIDRRQKSKKPVTHVDSSSGYKRIYLAGKSIKEHKVVMEKMIGRPLVKGETVHHRNGVRDDNRPENLELWAKPQPTGIRAEDALKWAYETIDRYEPIYGLSGMV